MSFRGPSVRQHFQRRPLLLGATSLFLLLAALYCFSIGLRSTRGHPITGDEPFYLVTTQSLIQDGDLDLRQQYDTKSYESFFKHPDGLWKQSIPIDGGRILSPHEPGLSVLLIPGFLAGELLGAQVQLLLIAALTFALTYVLVAQETGRYLQSWLVTAAVGLSATAFVYSTEVYPEVPAALCLVLSLLILRREKQAPVDAVALVLVLTAVASLSMKYVPLGCLLAVFYLWRADLRSRATFLALSAASGAAYAGLHLAWFDHLTAYSINTVYQGTSDANVVQHHLAFSDRVYRLYGLFIDRRFGLGHWSPMFLLVLPALPLLLGASRIRLAVAGLIAGQVCIATFMAITMMGYWFPGRTLMTVLPLFALVLTLLLMRLPKPARWCVTALAVASLYFTAGLVLSYWAGEVRLAVDPFLMKPPLFQAAGHLFPDYRTWSANTVLLTAAWLSLFVAGGIWSFRQSGVLPVALSRLPRPQRPPRTHVPGRSSAEPLP